MAKITWVKSRYKSKPPRSGFFKKLRYWYFSLDSFTRSTYLILFCILVITPIVISGYLIFRSKASTTAYAPPVDYPTNLLQPPKSAWETFENNYGQSWANFLTTNPYIPLGYQTGYNSSNKPFGFQGQLRQEDVNLFSKASSPLVIFDQEPTMGTQTYNLNFYTNVASQLHAVGKKTIAYFTPTKGWDAENADYDTTNGVFIQSALNQYTNPTVTYNEQWFVHNDPNCTGTADISMRLPHDESKYIMDITNPDVRNYMAQYVARMLNQNHMDGIFIDWVFSPTFFPTPVADRPLVCPTILNNWASSTVSLFAEIKQYSPNMILFYNNIDLFNTIYNNQAIGYQAFWNWEQQLMQHADGVEYEFADESKITSFSQTLYPKSPTGVSPYQELQNMINFTVGQGKYLAIGLSADGYKHILNASYPNVTYQQQSLLEEYYLAFLMTFYQGNSSTPPKMFGIFNTQTPTSTNYQSEEYFANMSMPIGDPDPANPIAVEDPNHPGLFLRKFTHGYVIWDNIPSSVNSLPITVQLPQPMVDDTGNLDTSYTVYPRDNTQNMPSAMIFATPDVYPPNNLSFETPWNWLFNGVPSETTVDATTAHSGVRSMHIGQGFGDSPGVSQAYTFSPGNVYQWSAWVKTANSGSITNTVRAIILPNNMEQVMSLPLNTNGMWQQISMCFDVPSGASVQGSNAFILETANQPTQGDVWFDDISLTLDHPDTQPATNTCPTTVPAVTIPANGIFTPMPTPTPTPTPPPDTILPIVSLTAPTSTSVARRSTVAIAATASDNVGVTRVLFLVNGVTVCTDTAAPYSCNWSVSGKSGANYTITANAYDASGNIGRSAPINVTSH